MFQSAAGFSRLPSDERSQGFPTEGPSRKPFYSKQKWTVSETFRTLDLYREVLHNLTTNFTKITTLKQVTKPRKGLAV